jgi:hypothetical protein
MGFWTALTNQPTFNASQMLQLTDGTIIVQEEDGNDASRHWWRLTPDKFGNYISGTWSKLADMANSRRFYASAVLADGRVLVAGGEYSDAGACALLGRRAQPSSVSRSSTPRLKGAIGLPVRISLLPPIRRTLADYNLFNASTTQDTRTFLGRKHSRSLLTVFDFSAKKTLRC